MLCSTPLRKCDGRHLLMILINQKKIQLYSLVVQANWRITGTFSRNNLTLDPRWPVVASVVAWWRGARPSRWRHCCSVVFRLHLFPHLDFSTRCVMCAPWCVIYAPWCVHSGFFCVHLGIVYAPWRVVCVPWCAVCAPWVWPVHRSVVCVGGMLSV